jgi:hypothetical protein
MSDKIYFWYKLQSYQQRHAHPDNSCKHITELQHECLQTLKGTVLTLISFLLWLVALMWSYYRLLLHMSLCTFCSVEGRDFGWLGMWGSNPEWLRHVGIQPLQPGAGGKWGNYFSQGTFLSIMYQGVLVTIWSHWAKVITLKVLKCDTSISSLCIQIFQNLSCVSYTATLANSMIHS